MRSILEAVCKTQECPGVFYIRDLTADEIASGQIRQTTKSGINLLTCEVCGKTSNYILKDMQPRQLSAPS
jgi:hypothetical protein